jgi:hypothetical protein
LWFSLVWLMCVVCSVNPDPDLGSGCRRISKVQANKLLLKIHIQQTMRGMCRRKPQNIPT